MFCRLLTGQAQTILNDSVSVENQDITTEFLSSQLIVPASLIAIGVLGIGDNMPLSSMNRDMRDEVAERRKHFCSFDDYTRFVPLVASFGLDWLGAKPKHHFLDRSLVTATAYLSMGILVEATKRSVNAPRPDFAVSGENNSFPSGHTATAFVGAEIVRREYWDDSPWYGVGAYTVATATAVLRVYNERHFATDVIAGAGFGILSANIAYWLLPWEKRLVQTWFGQSDKQVALSPYYSGGGGGVSFVYGF